MTDSERLRFSAPCAACRRLRRKCGEKCVLAPYFPSNSPQKFAAAHEVFGASAVVKTIQDLPERQRADAVDSMVYEAAARLRDPVHGCAGIVRKLQKQVADLQSQLATAQAELLKMQSQQAILVANLSASLNTASVEAHPFSTPCSYYALETSDLHNSSTSDMEPDTPEEWEPLWAYDMPEYDA